MLACRYNYHIFTKQIINDTTHFFINKQLVDFKVASAFISSFARERVQIFSFISMSPLAGHHFVASNILPASHRFSEPLLGLLIRRMEHKITLSTYARANISPTMKLQQTLASTFGVAQTVQ
jgi:hypothetical protein